MKSNKYSVSILLISILIMTSTLNTNYFQSPNQDFVIDQEETFGIEALKKAGFWDEIEVAFIHISFDNWSAQDLPWVQNRTGTWEDPHRIENITIDGTGKGFGIKIENSNEFFVIRNVTVYNAGSVAGDAALILNSVSNGRILENNFSNNYVGVNLIFSSYNNISGNTIFNNQNHGLLIEDDSDHNNIMGNSIFYNQLQGMRIDDNSDYNSIQGNIIRQNTRNGIFIYTNCMNNVVSENFVSNNSRYGILIEKNSDFNKVFGNTVANNSYYGIFIYDDSDNNIISSNEVYNNLQFGISIERNSDNNLLIENTVYLNNWAGICIIGGNSIRTSYNNTIYGNLIFGNTDHGIELRNYVSSTTISRNVIKNNDLSGIALRIDSINNSYIWGNLLKDNNQYGVSIEIGGAIDNLIFQNSFSGNILSHGIDNGANNDWNNSIIGNYWDNHTSPDSENDGIVDIPYTWISGSANSIDNFPLTESPVPDGEKIHIDDSGISALNWSITSKLKLWCTGTGTYSDPYVIDNLEIDGGGSGSGILIGNSSIYFIIQNSTIYNVGTNPFDAGIKMEETINGKLIRNNCSNNNYGIVLNLNCDNNRLSRNIVNENSLYGIYILNNCNNNLISGNTVSNLFGYGIYIADNCHNNTISGNIANNNGFDGIYLEVNSNNNKILGNSVNDNDALGIHLYNNCDNNTILGNNASNVITTNQFVGIVLEGFCDYNTISGNNASNNFNRGISLETFSHHNNISGNTANDNFYDGIFLTGHCENNTISENNISNLATSDQDYGIRFSFHCNGNKIFGNFAFNNTEYGIYFDGHCDRNIIMENSFFFNTFAAILINSIDCDDNKVTKNIFISKDWKFIIDYGSSTEVNMNYYSNNFPSFGIEIITQLFSTTEFVITIKISCELTGSGVSPNFIEIHWNGTIVSSNDITEIGNGLYNITLSPIFVESGEDPILLNMTISSTYYTDKYYETFIAIEPESEPEELAKLIHIDILSQIFSIEKFNITFFVCNESNHGIDSGTIQMWWNSSDVSSHIQNLGDGYYFVSLKPITVKPGEDPIILEIAIFTFEYEDLFFETYIAVDSDTLIKDDASEFPFHLIMIIITSIAGGIGMVGAILFLLHRRKGVIEVINTNEP